MTEERLQTVDKAMNLEDIAARAGVSRSTVSRVINNQPYVSQKTRDRVLAIIDKEGFSPNPAARALVTQKTNVIGVAIPHVANVFFGDNSYYPMLLQGIGEATNDCNHTMLLWLQSPNENKADFNHRISRNRLMDGLIIASVTASDPLFYRLVEQGTHFVMVERPPQFEDRVSYVAVNNVQAAETAVQHLINLGRRRIATITGHLEIKDGEDRLIGYQNVLRNSGRAVDPNLIYYGVFDRDSGYRGMKQLLQHKPDAVFAAGDTTARGAIQAIEEAGLRVPDDIAMVGFDDLDVATQFQPTLTTIRQPIQEKGALAARLLIDLIEGKIEFPQHILLPTELIVRQSCGGLTTDPDKGGDV